MCDKKKSTVQMSWINYLFKTDIAILWITTSEQLRMADLKLSFLMSNLSLK